MVWVEDRLSCTLILNTIDIFVSPTRHETISTTCWQCCKYSLTLPPHSIAELLFALQGDLGEIFLILRSWIDCYCSQLLGLGENIWIIYPLQVLRSKGGNTLKLRIYFHWHRRSASKFIRLLLDENIHLFWNTNVEVLWGAKVKFFLIKFLQNTLKILPSYLYAECLTAEENCKTDFVDWHIPEIILAVRKPKTNVFVFNDSWKIQSKKLWNKTSYFNYNLGKIKQSGMFELPSI